MLCVSSSHEQRCTTRQSATERRKPDVTFPRATADVAMSRTKLSPPLPGAATLMGLVPKVH